MIRHGLVAIIIAVVASAGLLAQGSSPPPGTRNDQDAITAVMAATTDAFSRHDASSARQMRNWSRCAANP